jgi:ferric-dicitrate binding protein FerR (iron transport regulator)
MNCKEVRESMSLYLAGEVSESAKALIQAHIETCKECPVAYERAKKLEGLICESFRKITPVVSREEEVIEKVKGADILTLSGELKGNSINKAIAYATAASVMLVSFALIIFMIKTNPNVTEEAGFVAERIVVLNDGSKVLLGKDSSIRIDEAKGEVILEKGHIRLYAKKSDNAVKIITPFNTVIKKGNDFIINDGKNNKIVNVYGSIELSTQ